MTTWGNYRPPTTRAPLPAQQCKECGVDFIPKAKDRTFCGYPCASQYNGRRLHEHHEATRAGRARPCTVCGTLFLNPRGISRRTCSEDCLHTLRSQRQVAYQKLVYATREQHDAERRAEEHRQLYAQLKQHQLERQAVSCLVAGLIWRQRGFETAMQFIAAAAEART